MEQSNNKDNINKSAKYFCENCGTQVKADAKICPACGKFFSSVRCPQCGYMGTVKDFSNGCPRCHYSMSYEDLYGREESSQTGESKAGKKRKSPFSIFSQKDKNISGDVPSGVFAFCIIALVIIIAIILFRFNQNL